MPVDLYETFVAPLASHPLQRALGAILLIAVPAGLLGAWVVVRRLAFASHAIGHATFPALVIAAIAGWSLLATTVAAALLVGILLAGLARRPEVRSGTAAAVVLSTSLALGAVLVSDLTAPGITANGLLFGSIFGLRDGDLLACAAVAALALGATLVGFRPFTAAAFDGASAGIRRHGVDAVLILVIAVAVAVSARVMGSLLVGALFVIPSATARQFTARLPQLIGWGVLVAAVDGVAGLWLAATFDTPPGASIAAFASLVFAVTALARAANAHRLRTIPT